jgi:hypothetical protein
VAHEITLVVPAEENFRPLVRLVVAGLAVPHELTLETLEDCQLALDALLARRDDAADLVLKMAVDERGMRVTVGPLPRSIVDELESDAGELDLRCVLETVCDTFEAEERNDGAWVELAKQTTAHTRAGG